MHFSRGVSWPHLPLCADTHGHRPPRAVTGRPSVLGADLPKYLTIILRMSKTRSTYDGRLIYRTSYDGHTSFHGYSYSLDNVYTLQNTHKKSNSLVRMAVRPPEVAGTDAAYRFAAIRAIPCSTKVGVIWQLWLSRNWQHLQIPSTK